MTTEQTDYTVPGTQLANGATVLLGAGPTIAGWIVVLADFRDELVTWKVDPATGNASWGDYYQDALEAAEGFAARVRENHITVEAA